MKRDGFLARVRDDDLLVRLRDLAVDKRRNDAAVIAYIDEIDRRRLFAREGFPSMIAYCVQVLNLSEGAAAKRLWAARTARRFPVLFSMVARGEIHLAGINVLARHLTADNVERVLERAKGKSKRELEELAAELAPRPPVPSVVRKVPVPRKRAPRATGARSAPDPAPVEGGLFGSAGAVAGSHETDGRSESSTPRPAAARRPGQRRARSLAPLAPATYKLQCTVDEITKDKLERARGLARHRLPGGELGPLLDLALDALIDRLEREQFARTPRPRETAAPRANESASATAASPRSSKPRPTTDERPESTAAKAAHTPGNGSPARPAAPTVDRDRRHSRGIAADVRRRVAARDQYCCAYVSPDGRRCGSRDFLQFHHRDPHARGGGATVDNLALYCATHNAYAADVDYGRAYMAERRGPSPGTGARDVVVRYRTEGQSPGTAASARRTVAGDCSPSDCRATHEHFPEIGPLHRAFPRARRPLL